MTRKRAMRKKKLTRTDIIIFAVVAIIAAIIIALLVHRDIANRNPCDTHCAMHPVTGICHCHGTCGTEGCRCHGADEHDVGRIFQQQ
ncbi:MAG: hypothetical protein FWB96_05440 [Defluviitaleaceae bacterium]|nr:hypothetical protein [Defluviitaleaceae bacterium]MCL2263028.1 hypothetical protein [Defluviitaleaceae bacterium]